MDDVKHYLRVQCKLGEGPLWDWRDQSLVWVDIDQNKIHQYFPEISVHTFFDVDFPVGVLALRANGGYIAATGKGFAFWDSKTNKFDWITNPEEGQETRFNDGAVDCNGRFWAGTIHLNSEKYHLPVGKLYRLDPDRSVHLMESELTISNGLDWSPDNKVMYLTDTIRQKIYAYDFDQDSGNISNRRDFIHTPDGPGYPDGLAVDLEGFVWSARIAAGKLFRYDPLGQLEREIKIPVTCPTSCAFGGENLHKLFITTSWHLLSDDEKVQQPQAGDLFCFESSFNGLRANLFAG